MKLGILVIFCTYVITLTIGRVERKLMVGMEEMRIKVEQRDQLDSLYREHLDQCSFIGKDEVEVDSRGYFYSKYHNDPLYVVEHTE